MNTASPAPGSAAGSAADPQLPLTALLITYNEIANLSRTLATLQWVPRILVIDSGSTDGTLTLLAAHAAVEVLHRPFDSFAEQCNFGLAHVHSEWVLSLDADYVLPPPLVTEIRRELRSPRESGIEGYAIRFRYCVAGRPLRGTLLPPRTSLFRTRSGRYRNDGHGHRVQIAGRVAPLRNPMLHDDRKPLSRWLASQQRYLAIEGEKLRSTPSRELSAADRLRKHTVLAPLAALVLCLVWKGGILDGWQGWFYALQRTYAELLLKLMLLEERSRMEPP